eukprot:CAMPEP_0172469398 /NCGR_PEP_ID=MMETSP1065-20121228/63643_1 /TAXON_ID=265537 /ORGANISM="Amphiprora paludosa, Strain CCMP125" /LENGTH=142 /DNA_ID=CAMNT_0013227065 /DNA_START=496 /DNA_END=924 /DNA_ORIENTATION=-
MNVAEKLNATFCLEAGGNNPSLRKSISDSIASGCIPVFFANMTDQEWPWHFQFWKAAGRVLVPRLAFVEGRLDLITLLHTTLPPAHLQTMQQTLGQHARGFQYSLNEDERDGIRLLLEGLKEEAHTRVDPQTGHCLVTPQQE